MSQPENQRPMTGEELLAELRTRGQRIAELESTLTERDTRIATQSEIANNMSERIAHLRGVVEERDKEIASLKESRDYHADQRQQERAESRDFVLKLRAEINDLYIAAAAHNLAVHGVQVRNGRVEVVS